MACSVTCYSVPLLKVTYRKCAVSVYYAVFCWGFLFLSSCKQHDFDQFCCILDTGRGMLARKYITVSLLSHAHVMNLIVKMKKVCRY